MRTGACGWCTHRADVKGVVGAAAAPRARRPPARRVLQAAGVALHVRLQVEQQRPLGQRGQGAPAGENAQAGGGLLYLGRHLIMAATCLTLSKGVTSV